MRVFLIALGLVLLVAGLWVTLAQPTYDSRETLVQFGPAKLETTKAKPIPGWVGIAGIAVGGLIALGGIANRKR